jgi:hypothetical protein
MVADKQPRFSLIFIFTGAKWSFLRLHFLLPAIFSRNKTIDVLPNNQLNKAYKTQLVRCFSTHIYHNEVLLGYTKRINPKHPLTAGKSFL